MTSLRSYVWWLRHRHIINRVLAVFGLRLWGMADFQERNRWMFYSERFELKRWWFELHRLSWVPPRPEVWRKLCATVPKKGEPQP